MEHTPPCGSRAIHLARAITEQEHRPLCEVVAEADASWRDECDRAEAKRRAAEEYERIATRYSAVTSKLTWTMTSKFTDDPADWAPGELAEAWGK